MKKTIPCGLCGKPLVWHPLPTEPPHWFAGFLHCDNKRCDPYPSAWGVDEADAIAKAEESQ